MEDPKNHDDNQEQTLSQTVLESPPVAEAPAEVPLLHESVSAINSRLSISETFLTLLHRDSTFKDFTRDLLVAVMKVVKSEAGSLFEVDHKNSSLFFRAVVGRSSDRIGSFQIPMGKGIVGHVAESRQPLVVSNVNENRQHLKTLGAAVGFEARNMVTLPIVIRGRIYGVLQLLNRVGEDHYTDADMELLKYSCEMAAKAIEVRLMLAWALKNSTANSTQPLAEAAVHEFKKKAA
jgi:putative methionine-R-sulfoxide reductase with GAF domain